jgi:hypothetical protein
MKDDSSQSQAMFNASQNTAVPFFMEYNSLRSAAPYALLTVSSLSITAQLVPVDMLFGAASDALPNVPVLTVKHAAVCAALSNVTLSSGFSLSTVGSVLSMTVIAYDQYANAMSSRPNDALQLLYSKVLFFFLAYCALQTLLNYLN